MESHFLILSIFAVLVSIGFALLMRDTREEQIRFAIFAFVCFVGSAFVIGWLMYPFPQ
jgi:cytochrome bd-type quinol oxidase subunit 2